MGTVPYRPAESPGFRLYLERDLASMLWKPPVASMPGLCPPGTGDLVASRPRNAKTATRQTGTISPSQSSGEAGRPGLPRRHRHLPYRFHAALDAQAAPAGLENSAVRGAPLASLADIRANVGLLSGEALEAVLRDKASSVHHFWGLRLWVLLQNKRTIRPKQKKHTLTHFNEQELSCVHHARSAAVHGLPATPGAGVDEQRQPAA